MSTSTILEPLPARPEPSPPIIVFEKVSIAFDDNTVLREVSFELEKGETKAIFGVAGAGKARF